jgi:hypothetical protein
VQEPAGLVRIAAAGRQGQQIRIRRLAPATATAETPRGLGQACRQRWRALALVIKAKLEAVESGITTFEDEFLAHIVMPDGKRVADHVKPTIARVYDGGQMLPLLPPPAN